MSMPPFPESVHSSKMVRHATKSALADSVFGHSQTRLDSRQGGRKINMHIHSGLDLVSKGLPPKQRESELEIVVRQNSNP